MAELSVDLAKVLVGMKEFSGKVGRTVAYVARSKHDVLKDCNVLISRGLLDEDGLVTEAGKEILIKLKSDGKPTTKTKTKDESHANGFRSVNLRCPKCKFFAKTSAEMMGRGRLKCPVDGAVLATKEERGEKKGRY